MPLKFRQIVSFARNVSQYNTLSAGIPRFLSRRFYYRDREDYSFDQAHLRPASIETLKRHYAREAR